MAHHRSLNELNPRVAPVEDTPPVLNADDRRELVFDTLALFKTHVEVDAQQVYRSIDVIRAHVFRIYDEKVQGDYTAAHDQLQLDNDQLMGENARLHAEVATLRTRMTPRMTPPISSIYEMPGPEPQAFNPRLRLPKEEKSVNTKGPPAFNGTNLDVDDWIGKMRRKLSTNADWWNTDELRITYVDNLTENPAAKHLAARLRDNAPNRFTTAEEMFAVLQTAYGDTDKEHTARVKFQELRMTSDFSSFWAEFQVLASELKSHESTLIIEMQQKLTPALSRALAALPKPTNLQVYAEQCQNAYRNLQDLDKRVNKATASSSRYGCGGSTNANSRGVAPSQPTDRPATSLYARPPVATVPTAAQPSARTDGARLSEGEIARLRREERCFHCKEVGDHRPRCPREWQPMSVILIATRVNEVAVPAPGHVEAENA